MSKVRSPTQYVQYSKRLTAFITGFWALLRFCGLIAMIIRPSIAESMEGLLRGADDVMICNVGFYCGNSVAEKGIIHYFSARRPLAENMQESADTTSTENG